MALTTTQKDQILAQALRSRRTSVDGLTSERRSISELRDYVALCNDLDGSTANASPAIRIGIASILPPGALDG